MDIKEFDALVQELKEKKEMYDKASQLKTDTYNEYQKVQEKVLNTLKKTGKSKYHVDHLGTVYTITNYRVSTPKDLDSKRAFADWISSKYGNDVRDEMLGVNYQTLNSFVKKEFDAAEERGDVAFKIPGLDDPEMIESVGFRQDVKK